MSVEDSDQRLGRGLAALLGDEGEDPVPQERHGVVKEISLDLLRPNPYQPRHRLDNGEIDALAESIREHGVLQPIIVRRAPDDQNAYEIVAGERRWHGAARAGLHQVPAVIMELTHRAALEIALVENLQRQDLTALEEAEGYQRLIETFGHTQERMGQAVSKSRSHIANSLRLLELPGAVKEMLDDGRLSAGHARAVLTAPDPVKLARRIVAKGLNVRQAERLARRAAAPSATGPRGAAAKDADTAALEASLSAALGLTVDIASRAKGGGTVRISYDSVEQLDDIARRLRHDLQPAEI